MAQIPMTALADKMQAAAAVIRKKFSLRPLAGIILGTGLGSLAKHIETAAEIPFEELPHFPRATAISHAGRLVLGTLAGVPVAAMEGRLHAYEGYSLEEVTFPVRVFQALQAEYLIVSNACGGMNPNYQCGDVMAIDDHINLIGSSPLVGPNDDRLGPRFPDMSCPYDPTLIQHAVQIGHEHGFTVHRGVYVGVMGPNLETRAEYRFLRAIGADVVGMSTVPEAIVAVHAGMKTLGLSIVTDMCLPDALEPASIEKILGHAAAAEPKLRAIVLGVLARIAKS